MDLARARELFEARDVKTFVNEIAETESVSSAAGAFQNNSWRSGPHDLNGVSYSRVRCEGGGEGEGETVDWVYQVVIEGQEFFVNFNGSYYSYDGIYWDNDAVYFVEPKEVLVTQYFVIN